MKRPIRVCIFCHEEPGSPIITPNDEVSSCVRCASLCVELVIRKAMVWQMRDYLRRHEEGAWDANSHGRMTRSGNATGT